VALGLLEAFFAALCYGCGTVLQAVGARRVTASQGVDPRLLLRVLRSLPYVAGLGLDTVGLVGDLAALHELPLFTVQAVVNTNLAVTALVALPALGLRLAGRDWAAIAAVCLGLVLIALSAGYEGPAHKHTGFGIGLLIAAAVLAGAGYVVGNGRHGDAAVLGVSAGLLFGVFALCVRVLPNLNPLVLLRAPAAYALVLASVAGFLFFTTALQRGAVTAATAAMVVGETALPALLGVVLLGDHARHGTGPLAVLGFLLAVGGALPLARYGELSGEQSVNSASNPDHPTPTPADHEVSRP
jgi:drug/metabolite transporter (DMT)-like permease